MASSDIPAGETPVTAAALNGLARNGALSPPAFARARVLAGITPGAARWRRFLDRSMGIGAALLLATAVVFFIAFNWDAMGRFAKLGLLAAAVAAVCVAGIAMGPRRWQGRAALFAATVLAGALLAFIGQTYQTGADPWQLFATWALLSIPWALAAGWAPLWALLLVVGNAAVGLYFGVRPEMLGWFRGQVAIYTAMVAFNGVVLVLAELWGPRGDDAVNRLLPRLAATLGLGVATVGALFFILDSGGRYRELAYLYIATLAAVIAAYRLVRLDLLLLAIASLSAIVVTAAYVAEALLTARAAYGGYLAIAVTVIAMSAAAAHWIRSLARRETP